MSKKDKTSTEKLSEEELNEKYEQLKELDRQINDKIADIEENGDEKTNKKIEKYKKEYQKIKEETEIDEENIDDTLKKLEKADTGISVYQKLKEAVQTDVDIDPGRLMGLTDGIFSIVMTLLIFGMVLPEAEITNSAGFAQFLVSMAPNFWVTVISFILLACFWIYHHEFIKINNINILYLWLNIFYLASLSFIPFTTSIIAKYTQFSLANIIFEMNIFVTIILFLIMFSYVYNKGFLEKSISESEKKYTYHTFYILIGIVLLVGLLDNIYLFFLIPIISTIRDILFKIKKAKEEVKNEKANEM